jgi:hypothetical protein
MTGVQTMGDDTPIAPRFWIDDADATVLARSDHDNRTALAVRAFDDWTSVYLASPLTLDERFVRELARLAGVHVYHEGPDATYIGPGLIGIHAQHDGAKHITLPAHATVRELFANRIVARDADAFTYDMQQYETALFRYEPAP